MMDLRIFKNDEFGNVRTVVVDGEPWFVAKDVCECLDIGNPSQALTRLDSDEKNTIILNEGIGNPEKAVVNEYGLYTLVLGSRKPEAKAFKRWITHEVIPSIRKHGGYLTPEKVEEALLNPDTLIRLATSLKEERARREKAEAQVEGMKPKALFADAVATAENSILVGELAKLIKQNGVDIGEKRLFGWMREKGYLIARKGSDWNMPSQRSMELGILEIKERTINNPDGSVRITKTPKVTGKGQVYFVNKFLDQKEATA